ncbi:N-acyl homoserine lactonase family protein [Pseudonocardia oroxyli]|uniref:Glyoxylase, beta-lactamase superfamily II n=1 Tax=Pseudonocardia oroxyli TaxID=366584 RepID=A0A1G7X920_PSEOR|nr:N-acyl homoserine lactonase family protein [Pseudonocardia oroxyli]SDG80633.1 Glyoxylase, beta-lactamase superfamily II [Pseudonocardia oroxyli]
MYTVHAIRYATREGLRGQHFLGYDDTWAEPHPTAYYVWLAVSDTRAVVLDAGLEPDRAPAAIAFDCTPHEGVASLGVDPADVDTLVLSHLHYDHTGAAARFPAARRVVQRAERDYWTGPVAKRITREHWLRSESDLATVLAPDRLDLVDGEAEIAPGLSVHLVGGHTAGMQLTRVWTARGWVVLASDAIHFTENLEQDRPGPILHSMPGIYAAYDRIRELADSAELIVPGHDPQVMDRFPRVGPHAVRIA